MQEDKKIEKYAVSEDFDPSTNLGQGKKEGWKEKLNDFLDSKYFIPVIIILVAIISFSLGRISGLQDKRPPVRILNNLPQTSVNNSPPNPSLILREGSSEQINSGEVKGASTNSSGQAQPSQNATTGAVVASKNGTKYHYPWCAGAKQISAQNLITFNSIESARAAGYTPASNCKGLK